jgi:menaquinone-dependent protoporphyrinogen oxidase
VDVLAPEAVRDVDTYDGVVVGSAIYAGRWLQPARAFVDRHADQLAQRPVWLFSSGPVGDPPKPDGPPVEIEPIVRRVSARDHRTFPGRLDREGLGFLERGLTSMLHAPYGDFRDLDAVRSWAAGIAESLRRAVPA